MSCSQSANGILSKAPPYTTPSSLEFPRWRGAGGEVERDGYDVDLLLGLLSSGLSTETRGRGGEGRGGSSSFSMARLVSVTHQMRRERWG